MQTSVVTTSPALREQRYQASLEVPDTSTETEVPEPQGPVVPDADEPPTTLPEEPAQPLDPTPEEEVPDPDPQTHELGQ